MRYHSYRTLFKVEFKIYRIGDKRLPVPVSLDTIILTVFLYFPMYPIAYIINQNFAFLGALIFAAIASHLILREVDLYGKNVLGFIKGILEYAIRHKRTNLAGRKITKAVKQYTTEWKLKELIN